MFKNKKTLPIYILLLLITFVSVLHSDGGLGYLFRFKRVELKYYANPERIKFRHIDYQSLISENIPYGDASEILIDNLNELYFLTQDNINTITTIDDSFKETQESTIEGSILTINGVVQTSSEKDKKIISISFNNPLTLPFFTKSIEFWIYTSIRPLNVNFTFSGNNKNGANILKFSQSITIEKLKTWYLESFNIVVDTSSRTIENLCLEKIELLLPVDKLNDTVFEISLSELTCLSIVKNKSHRHIPAKRKYINFENEKCEAKWINRLTDEPVTFNNLGSYQEHSESIFNGQEKFFQFNGNALSSYNYLLIDFSEDFFVPLDNLLSIIVKGRGMGEEINFIIEDSRNIYYELSMDFADFKGWKAIETSIPIGFYSAFIDNKTFISYVKLLGMKINPGYDGKIDISIDDISSIIKYQSYQGQGLF